LAKPVSNRPPTWLEVAISNAGILKGTAAITWAWVWGITRESIGHEPTVEEVADFWNQSERTTYRDQAAFRKAFPTLDSPAPYVDNPQIKPLVEKAARSMKAFADKHSRKPNMQSATLKIGFLPYPFAAK
jgi:hypothetical protein